jgi:hypothetical protein
MRGVVQRTHGSRDPVAGADRGPVIFDRARISPQIC